MPRLRIIEPAAALDGPEQSQAEEKGDQAAADAEEGNITHKRRSPIRPEHCRAHKEGADQQPEDEPID